MALSDCEKCWQTPCSCGWEYRKWQLPELTLMRDLFNRLIEERKPRLSQKQDGQ